ncbi:MAG: copper resistance protein CopC [Microbacterium sp.]|nr:copper resistance protein CopC [Microbacterium sp.]
MKSGKATAAGIALAVAVALALALALAHATGARAHEVLIASSPRAGAVLDSGPSDITLTFSGPLLEGGAAVAVSDSDSRDWVAESPVVEDLTATVELDGPLPDGEYDVLWRVVSSDGHPISGAFTFEVGVGGSDLAAPGAVVSTPGPDDSTGPDDSIGLAEVGVWIVSVVVLVLAVGSASIWFLLPRTKWHGQGEERGTQETFRQR